MRDVLPEISRWIQNGQRLAMATVIQTWGSAPRRVGSVMAIRQDMQVMGSVSGGCIEGAVIEEALKVLETDKPRQLEFGVSDETAWSVGLSCGGRIKVFIEKHPAFSHKPIERKIWQKLEESLTRNQPCILLKDLTDNQLRKAPLTRQLLVFPDGTHLGRWDKIIDQAKNRALEFYKIRKSDVTKIEDQTVFIQVFPRPDKFIIIGASHIAVPLVQFARELNFETIIIDPRQVFASFERFPVPPDQLIFGWPEEVLPDMELNEDSYVVVLTHDPKIDDPALHILLKRPVAYIGALGSQKTHARRRQRLREAGFSEAEISRIEGPVGLPIAANTPQEIALSIMAQMVKIKNSRTGS